MGPLALKGPGTPPDGAGLAGNHIKGAPASLLSAVLPRCWSCFGLLVIDGSPRRCGGPGGRLQARQLPGRANEVTTSAPTDSPRPWWFPVQELRDPLVLYLEAWLADSIFGADRAIIPDIEWMNQVLLTVDIVNNGKFAEITIFGQPRVQNRVKSVLLSLASRHRQLRARAQKMKQLEEFLKAHASGLHTVQHPVA